MGSLLLNSTNDEIKIGDNWSIKITNTKDLSILGFYYKDTNTLPLLTIKNDNEYNYENNELISMMKIISFNGNVTSGDYKMYYKLENKIIDDSSYCSVNLDKNNNIVYIQNWRQVVPRKGTYILTELSQLQVGLNDLSVDLDFFQSQ